MIYPINTRSVTWAKMRLNLHHFGKDNNVKKNNKIYLVSFLFFSGGFAAIFFNDEQF